MTTEQQKQLDFHAVEEARLKVLLLQKQCDALDASEKRADELLAFTTWGQKPRRLVNAT